MKQRRRIYYSAEQRAEIWDRWQRGGVEHRTTAATTLDLGRPPERRSRSTRGEVATGTSIFAVALIVGALRMLERIGAMADNKRQHISTDDARAGETPHILRFILGISLTAVVILFAILLLRWFVG